MYTFFTKQSVYWNSLSVFLMKTMNKVFDVQKLYSLLQSIPYGKVVTYGKLAALLGNKSWARAVGNALHKNPDGEKIPCYKVVNSKGELSLAYAFGGIEEQQRRLENEEITVENYTVDIKKFGW